MDIENIMNKTGGCGIYSFIAFFLLSVHTFKQAVDFQGLNFALNVPKFVCDINSTDILNDMESNVNISQLISKDQCSYKRNMNTSWIPCTRWIYDRSQFNVSLITELDLICSMEYYRDLMYTMFLVGMLAGYPISIIGDRYGRRYFIFLILFISVFITISQILIYNIYGQLIFALISGATKSISTTLTMTILIELTSKKCREITITNYWSFYTLGYICTAAFGYVTKSWRFIYLLSLIPSVFYIFYLYFIRETPRWLMVRGKYDDAFKVLSFISKINGGTFLKDDLDKCVITKEESGSFFALVKNKRMLGRCLILGFMECSFSFAYIGTSTNINFASNNIFISVAVMGLVELPSGPLASVSAKTLGRKKAIISLCTIGIVCLLTMPFMEINILTSKWKPWMKVILAMGGKLGFTSAWCVADMYSHELIPTANRNGAISIVFVCSGVGSILAPIIIGSVSKLYFAAPCILYSFSFIITAILVLLFLPETQNVALSQSIDQALYISKGKNVEVDVKSNKHSKL